VRFSGHTSELVRHFYIHFDVLGAPPLLFPTFQAHLARPFEIPDFSASEAVQKLARHVWTHDNVNNDEPPDAPTSMRAKSLIFEAFAACLERWPVVPDADLEWARPALEHIEAHLAKPPTNAELAALCHFSSDYFIVRFRSCIGRTPGQYLLERRLAVAAQKLLFSSESIESVAAQTGFCDRFHLSRAFKMRFGLSPAAYRKNRTA
jgi:AraC-like DNA-binding protein